MAIPRLLDAHGDRIFAVGIQLCGSRDDAEDLIQETFLRPFRSWKQFKGHSAPSTWLYRIAVRACHRLQRRRSGEPPRVESLYRLLPSDDRTVPDIPSL